MADSNIGSLPQAANLDDDSLLVAEQQGAAVKVTGAQFKEFGRQAVIGQVQSYVDQAEAAANRAVDAVSAVTDMTVEAVTLPSGQSATVTKTTKNDKVNLAFGLPRGEQGVPGPAGETGPRGPQGPTGKGLTILGYYDTQAQLEAAVPSPNAGDAYGVGTEAPYDIYVFDKISNSWVNNGQLSGGGGGPLPENVVTAEGGASMTFPLDLGDGPHTITFVDDEEPPLTAEDIQYSDTQSVKDAIDGLKSSVSDGKALVASAITDKGVPTAQDATFQQMADNIGQISGGGDTSDATATSFDILAPKTAYTAAGKVEGVIPTLLGQTITPGTADKTIANGQYLGGTQVIKGDPNLTSGNIKSGVSIFGVAGALESTFQATLTVTADVGAVVTATHSGGTKVEGLSTTGTVVLELPLEGTWSVTAVRGAAQYNTVTIQVTSQYNASLTAEVHIEYYGTGEKLSVARYNLAATHIGNYALFGGGETNTNKCFYVDAYDKNFTRSTATDLSGDGRYLLAAATNKKFAIFGGGIFGYSSNETDAYGAELSITLPQLLSEKRHSLAAVTIGEYILFGGGTKTERSGTTYVNTVDAYNENLVHSIPAVLSIQAGYLAASANDSYAIFAGGYGGTNEPRAHATAYDKSLTRSLPSSLSTARYSLAAEKAGNYVLFAGGNKSDAVDAYDLFLTRTSVEPLYRQTWELASASVSGYAVFGGGASSTTYAVSTITVYDPYLVRTTSTVLNVRRSNLAAASIGNSVIFGGGDEKPHTSGGESNVTDIYRYV